MQNTEKTIVGQRIAPAVKKLLSLLLAIAMLFSITAGIDLSAYAYERSGDYWYKILEDGTVEIIEYNDSDSIVSIPSTIAGKRVTSIGDWAFHDCTNLTSVTIPNSVTIIGDYAFGGCSSLINVAISNSVISIGEAAFVSCISLTNITIPNSVISIGSGAFDNCTNLTSITIPNTITSINDGVFWYCESLSSIVLPDGIISIGLSAFKGCANLTNITLSNHVKSIGECAFEECNALTDVYYNGTKSEWSKIVVDEANENLITSTIHCKDGVLNCKHEFDNGTITKTSTCVDTGIKTYTCRVCGEIKTEIIPTTGHAVVTDNAVSPTCIEIGLTEGSHCSVCKDVIIEQEIVPATGHNYKTTTSKATTKKNGSVVKKCSVCGATTKSTIYYPKTITLSATSYTYDGKAKKPTVTVKDSKGKKIAASNYTVTYASGRKNVGTYTVTIKFKGNYSGTVKKTFTIKPKATTLSSVTAGKKKFTVKWKKLTTQTTGYQIQYSTDKNFKKNNKTVTVSKNKTTSKSVSKLTAKKKYYVRIRTYKTVKVNGKSTKIYSSWSKAKSVTTKK